MEDGESTKTRLVASDEVSVSITPHVVEDSGTDHTSPEQARLPDTQVRCNSEENEPLQPQTQSPKINYENNLRSADDDPSGEGALSYGDYVVAPVPPDGGLRAWLVMLGSFTCNGVIFGTINSGGVIFKELQMRLEEAGDQNSASQASLTISLAIGTTFLLSMLAGVCTDKFGIRPTTIVGGAVATLGIFLSSIFYLEVQILTLTMGLMFGVGASLAYTPSLVILGHYFRKRIGIINGIVTAGSSIWTITITQMLTFTIKKYGLKVAFQVLSAIMSSLIVCGVIFKPFLPDAPASPEATNSRSKSGLGRALKKLIKQFINVKIWRNKLYVIWALAIPSALFGYFVPYVHLIKFAQLILPEGTNTQVLVQCMSFSSGVGRILFGFIADKPRVNRVVLQQISFFCIGVMTMLLTTASAFWSFIVISLIMGIFDGGFISLLGPIAFDIVGPSGASQAIGNLLAMCSVPLTLGPFIAGVLYDRLKSYTVPFLCAGIPPIVGCFVLCLMRCVKTNEVERSTSPSLREEKKNNEAPESAVQEEHTAAQTNNLANSTHSSGGLEDSLLQVDVRQLVNLQRESSV